MPPASDDQTQKTAKKNAKNCKSEWFGASRADGRRCIRHGRARQPKPEESCWGNALRQKNLSNKQKEKEKKI